MTEGEIPRFNHPDAAFERSGFYGRPHFEGHRLPGTNWESGNMFDGLMLPNLNVNDNEFDDTVWKFGYPDRLQIYRDPVIAEVFDSDAMRRLQAVEQLTLPPYYSTIPNTGAFSRFEHLAGSVLFAEQFCQQEKIPWSESTSFKLRTLVSDLAHTYGSHLGDWLFQGIGESEDQHDAELHGYLETTGVNDILRKYNYDPEDIIFPDIVDWVEAPQPDLSVDRVDYGLREMNRWNDIVRRTGFSVEDFTMTPDGRMAMRDEQRARIFSEGYLLLSQEHWSESTHRFLEDMLILRSKLFYAEGRTPNSWVFGDSGMVNLQDIHPRDLMYVNDFSQLEAQALPSLGGHTIDAVMRSVSQYRRQFVWPGRRSRIAKYMSQFSEFESYDRLRSGESYTSLESDSLGSYADEYPQALPLGFAILDADDAEATKNEYSIDLPQPPFKLRQIDPLVDSNGEFQRLSQIDPTYAIRLQEHRQLLGQQKVARLTIPDPNTYRIMSNLMQHVETHWQHKLQTTRRMSSDELRGLISVSANEIHGPYPFLTYIDY